MISSKTILTSTIVLLLCAALAHSAPAIVGASGTFGHGQTVTINGSGFGSHSDYNTSKPYLNAAWEDLETGKVSGDVNAGNPRLETGGKRNSKYHAAGYRWSSAQTFTNIKGEKVTTANMYSISTKQGGKTIFISGWYMFPTGFVANITAPEGSKQTKFMMMSPSDNNNKTYFTARGQLQTNTEDGDSQRSHGTITEWSPENTWHRFDIYASLPSVHKWYVDGKLVRGGSYASGAPSSFSKAGWIQYQFTGSNTKTWIQYVDDMYMSLTQARVELSRSSTWSESQQIHKEIQLPLSWSSSSIKIRVNAGSFVEGDKAYLYVIDAGGSVSKSIPVTIGASSSGTFLNITTDSLPDTRIGQTYNQTLQVIGGKSPYVWMVTSGSLPEGLSLNPTTGVISGSPTKTDYTTFTVQVTDASSPASRATKEYTIWVKGSLGVRLQESARMDGSMDGWMDGCFNILGRQVGGAKSPAMHTIVIRNVGGKIVRQIK